MNADILNDLAARVEALEGADREVDAMAAASQIKALDKTQFKTIEHWAKAAILNNWTTPRFTASIDAAMKLVPPDALWRVGHDYGEPPSIMANVSYDRSKGWPGFTKATASTPAIALTAAALRAHAAIAKENER